MNIHLLLLFASILYTNAVEVILTSNQGTVKGRIERSRGGRDYYAFYSIPYAQPPVGDLRFANPVPPKPWNGTRDATILPPPCITSDDAGHMDGEEDCLYLNLYTPKLSFGTKLPVIVFIYGGHFTFGHALPSRYGPQYFMDKDVILITFQFRLGALGFLSTEDDVLPGNYGLKDAIAVLKWVQENIESYGGDKNRVTLAGGSSGGGSAIHALISPLSKGLFHRVISQSGSPFRLVKPGEGRQRAWNFASHVEGCNGKDVVTSQDLKSCLMKLPADVIAKQNNVLKTLGHLLPIQPFGPVIENENQSGAFLVDDPKVLLSRNSNIPLIFGTNADDGGMSAIFTYYNAFMKLADKLPDVYHSLFPILSGFDEKIDNSTKLREISETIKKYFFGDSDMRINAQGFSRMFTVFSAIYPIKQLAELYKGPLYIYYYAHKNEESFAKMYGEPKEDMGVIHGDELISFFNWSEVITPVTEGIDLVVSEQLLTLWNNFAASGNPNGEKEVWTPVKSKNIEYLYIKDGLLEMRSELGKKDLEFIDKLSTIAYDQR